MTPIPQPLRSLALDEDSARQVVMVQAHDALPAESPLWTAEDRAWATRLARQTGGGSAPFDRFVAERARHAWQRLSAREPGLALWAARPPWRPAWLVAAALAGLATGLVIDGLASSQAINLLSPPLWLLVAWNVLVVAWALWPSSTMGGLRRDLALRLSGGARGLPATGPAAAGAAAWSLQALPLSLARAAALLHVAAAAAAVGMVVSLYLRGLVLDYRVGWQSTFFEAATVQALLDHLLAPARALSGVGVPAVAGLRMSAGAVPLGPAAPWLHLFATTLVLFVVLPRTLLAALALRRAARLSRALPLPGEDAYFRQLARLQSGTVARVQVWPHGAAPTAGALQVLRARLASTWGDSLELQVQAPAAVGDEDAGLARDAGPSTAPALRLAWFDLTATPEAETHGRWLQLLQAAEPTAPLQVVVDEAAFHARFGAYPARLAERRAAWKAWARTLGWVPEFLPAPGRL